MNAPELVKEDFMKFVAAVRRHFLGTSGKIEQVVTPMEVDFDYLDLAYTEISLLASWNTSSKHWFGIESDTTYYATMLTLIQRFEEMDLQVNGRRYTILSLGSGPGLYELFLCHYLRKRKVNFRLLSLDYSPGMIELQRTILATDSLRIFGKKVGVARESIEIVQGDMANLSAFAGKVDVVICNNSLQWVPDWKQVAQQIGTVMKPYGLGCAMFFVHYHAMKVVMGELTITRPLVDPVALAEEMYTQRFNMVFARSLMGGAGTGQSDSNMNRIFLDLKHYPTGAMPEKRKFTGGLSNMQHHRITAL
jgi:SAM-dependent methyltransferase